MVDLGPGGLDLGPGAELDAAVAEEVMGWEPPREDRSFKPDLWLDADGWSTSLTRYSADDDEDHGVLAVLRRMRALGYAYELRGEPTSYEATFYGPQDGTPEGHGYSAISLEHAVAIAAVNAVRDRAARDAT